MKQYFEIAEKSIADINTKNITVDGFKQKFNTSLTFAKRDIHMLISVNNEKITLTKFEQPMYEGETLNINDGKVEITNISDNNDRIFCKKRKRYCSTTSK